MTETMVCDTIRRETPGTQDCLLVPGVSFSPNNSPARAGGDLGKGSQPNEERSHGARAFPFRPGGAL